MPTRGSPPDAALAGRYAAMGFEHPFRPYQELALEAFERARASGDRRLYLTLPPGSGKTLLGLEVARRLARPTLVLAPNTAIVGQWLAQWSAFVPSQVPADDDPDLSAPLTVLTYQALCVLGRVDGEDEDHEAVAAADRPDEAAPGAAAGRSGQPATPSQRRRLVARGGDRAEVLGLLHDNGRAIVERLAARGPVTLVLDESHHLLELWGALLAAVIDTLGLETFVVALTATPPQDLGAREARLHDRLFGPAADFEVVAPAVVKDGHLAPYQELALMTAPLPHEERFIAQQAERFATLVREVQGPDLGSLPFLAWLDRRVELRRAPGGATVGWSSLEADDADLARAALRLRWSLGQSPPPGARYAETHRREPDATDQATLLDRWATEALAPSSDPRDREAWEHLRAALPSVGYRLTAAGVVRAASVVDRVLALSASKALGAARILSAEEAALGPRLRGLVLTDHESAGRDPGARLRGILDPAAGSAALVLRTLLDGTAVPGLDPVMVTGRRVACSRGTAERLARFAAELRVEGPGSDRVMAAAHALAGWDALTAAGAGSLPAGPSRGAHPDPVPDTTPPTPTVGWSEIVEVSPADPRWTPRTWVPLLTRFLAAGGSRCLIGTRALLGEGWDSPPVNVVIDLTTATTRSAVHQMRGRGMRLDRADPLKVADLWDVVCVADGHPEGAADHARFARKHEHDLAVGASGEVESGVSHVDPALTPFGPPPPAERDAIVDRALRRVGARDDARAAWRIGEPYRDVPVVTVRVRTGRSPGAPVRAVLRHRPVERSDSTRSMVLWLLSGVVGSIVAGVLLFGAPAGLGLAALLLPPIILLALATVGRGIGTLGATDLLGDLGRAVADALVAAGLNGPEAGAPAVRVVPQPDGWYRCLLEAVTTEESERFAEALDQLMSPLWDPRWLIDRPVLHASPNMAGALRFIALRLTGRLHRGPRVWHAVPDVLASRQDRVAAFESAWRRWVAPDATALRATAPGGVGILAARRGDDPFRTETQLRTLWT